MRQRLGDEDDLPDVATAKARIAEEMQEGLCSGIRTDCSKTSSRATANCTNSAAPWFTATVPRDEG
ncbi:hypothetical protein GGD81_001134 [Rhodobium orientis]|uniref:hypothetical protein n=1 Tax=Rhodobium orientis TaxID=34017 RepID=UPI0011B93A01|nr:hypothetical protein [Rhodobium orientis]MBB4302110.1 hypothetical protein [Rhodobium orientis]